AGSLRQAIVDANATANVGVPDEIQFNIPGSGVHTISPADTMPPITEAVLIDGYTQPGASVNTLAVGDNAQLKIEISGAALPGGVDLFRVQGGGGSTVRGLVVNQVNGVSFNIGFFISSNSNTIAGNFIGTDHHGTKSPGG